GAPIGEPLRGHDGGVNSVAFSPDGTLFVPGPADNTVQLLGAIPGSPLGPQLGGHNDQINSPSLS
ncbi:hypothetical protein M407DRAFT_48548, partial [Tulasnella calospora MUT 4182]